MIENVTLTSEDLKEIKTLTLDNIAEILFAEINYHVTSQGSYVDEHGTLIAQNIYELHKLKAYKRFAREIREWASLSLIYGAPVRIDASVKPYLQTFLAYCKRMTIKSKGEKDE